MISCSRRPLDPGTMTAPGDFFLFDHEFCDAMTIMIKEWIAVKNV